jgi:hypothetical protein
MNIQAIKRFSLGLIFSSLSLLLSACGEGSNHSLVTNKDAQTYNASLDVAWEKMSPHEQEAFNWAVQDFDLARLNKEYAGASPKEIIRAEVKKQIKISEEQIPALKQDVDAWEKEAATLRLITVSDASFYIAKDFFGDQPKIKAKMINKSGYDISSAKYYAALYIDDQPDPVATSIVSSNYKSIGEFKNSEVVTSSYTIGFVTGDAGWTTLEIVNAKNRVVKMSVIPDSVRDFGDRAFIREYPGTRLKQLENGLALAKSYKDI